MLWSSSPWDNGLAETFPKTIKRELASGKGYKTGGEAGRVHVHRALLQQAEDILVD